MHREERAFEVGEGEAGLRLDAFVAAALGASRAEARRVLGSGRVGVDGAPVGLDAKGRRVERGERVTVGAWTPPDACEPIPEPDAPLSVVAEGAGWVAVDKPAGQPVHPLRDGERGSVLNALVVRRPEVLGVGEGALRSGVVHRLDVDTSGVLLFATDARRFAQLRDAFRRHRVAKTYHALVAGRLEGEGELALHLSVGRHRPARVRALAPGHAEIGRSRLTRTRWRSLECFGDATLVEACPTTGFLHQIRVALAHLGHPLLGDAAYADEACAARAPRHMLHAAAVAFRDVEAEAPAPADFSALLGSLRGEC